MSRITTIIFDLDGTLYSSSELTEDIHRIAVTGLSLHLGTTPEEADRRLAAARRALSAVSGHETTLSAGCRELGWDVRDLHRHLAGNVNPESFITADDRVTSMLRRLGEKYRLCIYTNNNRPLVTRIMRTLGLDGLFESTYSIEDFWRAKPDRLALARLFAALGAEPDECLFVGDRYDVDLRLPEEHGSMVFLTKTVSELLTLEEFCSAI
jgi:putative hydrolase of the HAD superfamily